MVKAKDAIRVARSLIGTPYSELDCINLIKKVIRTAPGGVPSYTTAGSNALWNSYDASAKYKDLAWRQDGLAGALGGMMVFKASGNDFHHVGIATGEGTVIHSSSTQGGRGVVETPLTAKEGWTHLAIHRHIEAAEAAAESEETPVTAYKMQVQLQDTTSTVNVRKGPGKKYDIIGRLGHGAIVTVQVETEGWAFVTYGDSGSGYVSTDFLTLYEEPEAPAQTWTTLMSDEGAVIVLKGSWRIAED